VKAHVILPLISRRLSRQFGRGILPAYFILMCGRILLPDIRLVLLPSALLAASNWHDVTAGDVATSQSWDDSQFCEIDVRAPHSRHTCSKVI
jgi:hypothetical protein